MNRKFARMLALLMMLALVLSGCNLIEIDAKMQADDDIAAINKLYSREVAAYDGAQLTVGDVMGAFNDTYNETAYMYYYYFGTDISDEDIEMIADEVIRDRVRTGVAAAHFDRDHALSDDELAAIEEEFRYSYDEYLASTLEIAAGDTDAQRQEYARVIMREYGVDYDTLYTNAMAAAKSARMQEILREEITEVPEEALQAAYDVRVADQKELYTDGMTFESDMSSEDEIVCWMPEGYRSVKHILLMPDPILQEDYLNASMALETALNDLELLESEIANAGADLSEGASVEEMQAEIDAIKAALPDMQFALDSAKQACLSDVQPTLDDIYARLESGEDFAALIAEFGEDSGMQNEPIMSRGYYVGAESAKWDPNFRDAAMDLENVGDYTAEPVVSGSGVHIIRYESDVPAGEVGLENVREALQAGVLEDMRNAHCEEIITAWVEEANPSYNLQNMLNTLKGK